MRMACSWPMRDSLQHLVLGLIEFGLLGFERTGVEFRPNLMDLKEVSALTNWLFLFFCELGF